MASCGSAPSRDFASAATAAVTGITIDYHTPFSTHKLTTSANKGNVALARSCLRSHGKLKVTGRGRSARLTCSKPKPKQKPKPKH